MTISAQNAAAAAAGMKYPGKVPIFYLPSASVAGEQSGPAATRSKYNLVLVFVEGTSDGEAYLRSLSEIYPEILERAARVIAVVSLPLEAARALTFRLHLPFTLLAGNGAGTAHRLLGEEANAALCVADRYGIIYYLESSSATSELPPVRTALDWLDFVEIQCPECTDGSDSRWLGD